MYIKTAIRRKNGRSYAYQQLVESHRTPQGPRQNVLVGMGKLPIRKERFRELSRAIEAILTGQQELFPTDPTIKALAQHYAQLVIRKRLAEQGEEVPDGERLTDSPLRDFQNSDSRRIGPEAVAHWAWKRLGVEDLLRRLGFSQRQREVAALLVIGRAVHPSSENGLFGWAKDRTALDELLAADFQQLSHNTLYQVLDRLVENQEEIEKALRHRERDLFDLADTVVLYDLTNTFLEGSGKRNAKARYGHSKDRRRDCPLLTLGLTLDAEGFVRSSAVFSGNTAEVTTLVDMVERLQKGESRPPSEITVVIDRGIASEANLKALRERGYHYVVMGKRSFPVDEASEPGEEVKVVERQGAQVVARMLRQGDESILICQSESRQNKEQAMRARWEKRYEQELAKIAEAVRRPRGIKRTDKVYKRLGRLQALYPSIAPYYQVDLEESMGTVRKVSWMKVREEQEEERFSGQYFIRTSHTDWSEKTIWRTYTLLTEVEDTFRTLKTDLSLRPIFHQKEHRADGHIFVTVLAYHLVHVVRSRLKAQHIHYRWSTLCDILNEHVRVTTRLDEDNGHTTYIRNTVAPSLQQKAILDALGIPPHILRRRRLKIGKQKNV